jgi:diguanylate cyclase (GGDEF)-like protein
MRKVYAFGTGRGFAERYQEPLAGKGFELVTYTGKKIFASDSGLQPIILVQEDGITPVQDKGLGRALTEYKKPVVVLISSRGRGGLESLRKARQKAAYLLSERHTAKELISSLKSADELLVLRGKVAGLQDDLTRKSMELATVLEMTGLLSSTLEFSKVVTRIMERIRSLVGAETWALFLVDDENNSLVFSAARGVPAGRDIRLRLNTGSGIAGWAVQDMEPKLVNDVTSETRFTKSVDKITGVKTSSVMAVPISVKSRLLGVAELINKDGGFTAQDVDMVKMLMKQTALAVERSALYQRMEDLVITDDLTKLFNLRYLDRTLDVEIERATRYNLSVSLIFMDIDFFKNVNDRYGHLVGSKLLVEVSQLLLKGLRKVDIVARYGGDEFVIVLPQTGIDAAKMIAERLRKSIEKYVFLKGESLELKLTASFGIASYPEHASTQEELLKLADEAMYRVKYHTRNDVYVVGT